MTVRTALLFRPEPGNAATAARLAAVGVPSRACPLFIVRPVAWRAPDPGGFEALLLTSANAVRHAGAGLGIIAGLPVLAVGTATASAARRAGLHVAAVGEAGAEALVAGRRERLLHLAGRDRVALAGVEQITVYQSDTVPVAPETVRSWAGQLALLHSPRAARRFAALIDEAGVDRSRIGIASLSPTVADAAGGGWAAVRAADRPRDAALVALARELIDQPGWAADKRPK